MIDLKEEMTQGALIGLREGVANLLRVAESGDEHSRERARAGLVKLGQTTTMVVELIDEIFGNNDAA